LTKTNVFPHLFNKTENWGYKGLILDEQYYGFNQMKKLTYKEFKIWYEEKKISSIVFKSINIHIFNEKSLDY